MYLRINNKNEDIGQIGYKKQKIKDLLDKCGIDYDVFDYPSEIFFNEEASHRLVMLEEKQDIEIDKSIRAEVLSDISDAFFCDNQVICYDQLDDITEEIVERYISIDKDSAPKTDSDIVENKEDIKEYISKRFGTKES